jgi:hypothetical protein
MHSQDRFERRIINKWLFKLYLFRKLPLAFFAGLNVVELNEKRCVVLVPFKWLTQNPFHSIYFAAQAMAAEMSTGALGMLAIDNSNYKVSMLVVNMEARFLKKAAGKVYFVCTNGDQIQAAVKQAVLAGEGVEVKANSLVKLQDGTPVSNFIITWSFKAKM